MRAWPMGSCISAWVWVIMSRRIAPDASAGHSGTAKHLPEGEEQSITGGGLFFWLDWRVVCRDDVRCNGTISRPCLGLEPRIGGALSWPLTDMRIGWWCSAFEHDDIRDDLVTWHLSEYRWRVNQTPPKVFHAVNSGRSRWPVTIANVSSTHTHPWGGHHVADEDSSDS
jgi:hypothetical protein